jgi:glucokinase
MATSTERMTDRKRNPTSSGARPTTLAVVDCGGTNVRLALARVAAEGGVVLDDVVTYEDDAFAAFDDAFASYLARASSHPSAAAVAVAGPISNNAATLTNRPTWRVDGAVLAARFGLRDALVVNDFAAAARGAVETPASALLPIKDGVKEPGSPIVVGGPGTGFGMATVLPEGDRWRVLPGEGGHQTFAPRTPIEWELTQALRRTLGHVSTEVIAAGKHAEEVRAALFAVLGEPFEPLTPEEVLACAARGERGFQTYGELRALATMAAMGDATLMMGARGGAILMGGIAIHLASYLKADAAVDRFVEHGPMSGYLRPLHVGLASGGELALRGAARLYLDRA